MSKAIKFPGNIEIERIGEFHVIAKLLSGFAAKALPLCHAMNDRLRGRFSGSNMSIVCRGHDLKRKRFL